MFCLTRNVLGNTSYHNGWWNCGDHKYQKIVQAAILYKEQLSIVLRYVEGDSLSVREDLIGFVECDTGISGRSLANKIISFLEELGQISVVRLMMGQETWRVQLMVQQQ